MKEAMQGWRKDNPNNCAKDAPPQDKEHWRASGPETFGDISKGWGWWDIPVGLMRGGFPEEEGGGYGDSGPNDRVALASKLLGLIFSLNLDGFQTFNHGNYSTMGVYITVNNLPPHLRTIIENMLLVIVIPGPNEPTAYEFDQIMEPLIDDLVALGQGIRLNVHDQRQGHPEPELVYGHLGLAVLDHIARMKVCGHAVAEGFKLRENKLRDPLDQLDNKYCWLKAPSAAAREAIRQQTGIIFTVFNCLPGCLKAEQWKHIAIILPAALFEAWRDGDLIPNTFIPRGGRNTKAFKFQQSQAAEMLRNRKLVHRERGGLPRDDPKPLSCVAVRNRRLIYATICCYLVGRLGMVRHKVTREGIATSQRLLRRFGSDLARMNYPVTPNAHTALHLEESILQYGLLYGFHTAPFERANRVLININNNGHTGGVVEATMARGWLKRAGCHKLVCEMQGIENLSPDDIATTEMMLRAMRDGPEHERQRGRLNAILAGEENFRSQAILQLPTTSAEVNWTKGDHRPYWESVAAHCSLRIPNAVVYPYGLRPERGVRLTKKNSTRSLRHVHINGARYGTDFHRWAFNSCYAYIDAERHPVLIKRIYQVKLPVEGVDREVVCAVVQRFQPPAHKPGFPWDNWGDQLEIAAWQFAELDEPEVINVTQFSGTFALSDIEMETGHYWLTFAMYPTEPELFENGE
ncbi:hypothetical protein BN14_11135 [Rhizoctonia solani AG-1 IB]|uniref:Uncharacterized protein n=1 Tax=Thanatephorus cucumeris (strain AG1-IB / isolate 7/3/14) TaxID=1108050 RepID=M5CC02_THACB|nr:hypothetical protein BN14_11135 [Rhizoctonia solani AG-1 IB]